MANRMMRAVRVHAIGEPLRVDYVPVPEVGDDEVRVAVKAVHFAQYHSTALMKAEHTYPFYTPTLPYIIGMGAAGIIDAVGRNVLGFVPGQRVVINPLLSCGTCEWCQAGLTPLCDMWVLHGYYALYTPNGVPLLERYPGGFAEFTKVPARNVVPLDEAVPFELACRFNYTGVSYNALKKVPSLAGSSVLVHGATGTLGTEAVLLALAMGAGRVIAVGRDDGRLKALQQRDRSRITVMNSTSMPLADLVEGIRTITGGRGVDLYVDTQGYGSGKTPPVETVNQLLMAVRKQGWAVMVGALSGQAVAYDYGLLVGREVKITGSVWYNNQALRELVEMAATGRIQLDHYETHRFSLLEVPDAVALGFERPGGLHHIVVQP